MCIGLNLAYNDNSWNIFIFGVVVMIILFIDVFSTKNSAPRRLILIILSIAFLVGASVASVEDDYKWLAYLISLILFIAVIAYFVVTKKFNENLNIKSLFNLINEKTIFIYFVIAFTIVSLIFQCIQFSSNTKLGSFTIVMSVFIVLFILYFIIKNPLSSHSTPQSLKSGSAR
jgi:peptidoglycan/LPS O-acetylase OafA/YrhL